ncbi:MAG: DUF3105 domain-containing protein [Actinomycetota bacterium]|nr:DUF3105 domain-containing protein [Actinomycetota bacterium]
MAKKARTPPPPRRVQAPKRRDSAPSADAARRQRMILYALAASGLVLLAAVLAFLAFAPSGSGADDLAQTLRDEGCTFRTYESEGRLHINDLNAKVDYKTDPPTSGTHYAIPAVWDIYDRPINQKQGVHNLEHGGILIQYGSRVPRADVDRIAAFYRESPNGMLVAPLPRLGNKIALTAWTHMATCTRFTERGFEEFRDAYRAKGPEPFELDDLQPGAP